MHYGVISLLPPILTLFLAGYTKNIVVALFCGIVSCSLIINGTGFLAPIITDYLIEGVKGNLNLVTYILIFGGFITVIKRSGGFAAFSNMAERHFDSSKKSKFLTWMLSAGVCNHHFGTLGIGVIMRPVTDKYKVPREKLGFILSSTAENVVALVPITVYILFFGGLITALVPELNGPHEFIKSIPFNFFSIISIIVGLLVALELLPDIGYMRTCEKRARETGALIREGSTPLEAKELDDLVVPEGMKADFLSFLIPFSAFFGAVIIFYFLTGKFIMDTPILLGFFVAAGYSLSRGYITYSDVMPLFFSGAKSMLPAMIMLCTAFGFGKAVGAVGFANYFVEITRGFLTPETLPATVFLICCVGSFATGSLVSSCSLLAPLALTLAYSVDANLTLTIAAMVGGSTFGDCTSPLSDMVVYSAMGAGCDVVDLGKAQLPIRLIIVAIVTSLYYVAAVVMA